MILLYRIIRLITTIHVVVGRGRFCHYSLHYRSYSWSSHFHIIIITLQAFIFMMLTIVYLSMAHESH